MLTKRFFIVIIFFASLIMSSCREGAPCPSPFSIRSADRLSSEFLSVDFNDIRLWVCINGYYGMGEFYVNVWSNDFPYNPSKHIVTKKDDNEWISRHYDSFVKVANEICPTICTYIYAGITNISVTANIEIEGIKAGESLNDLFVPLNITGIKYSYPNFEKLDLKDGCSISEMCSVTPILDAYFLNLKQKFSLTQEQSQVVQFTVEFTLIDNEFHDGEFTIKGTSKLHSEL